LVIAQIILLSRWFNKKISQKDLVKMVEFKTTCLKLHFGQIGHGAKNPYGWFFLLKFLVKSAMTSCNEI
jgi:hypothetical protein